MNQTELDQVIERSRSTFLTTASLARLHLPAIRLLLRSGTKAPNDIDLTEQFYQHSQSVSLRQPHRPFAGEYAWPVEWAPSSSTTNSQTPWIEETCDPFRYKDLPGGYTRLLELRGSASADDPIKCRLHQRPVEDLHDYEVLSCVGAQSSVTLPITIDDKSFELPVALWDALRQVRLPDRSKFLWLDAVCLGLENIDDGERRAQLEHRILNRATRALVWLGIDDEDSQLVFMHLEHCRLQNRLNWESYKGQTKEAFLRLCRRPWFYRLESACLLATCQEVVLLCGSNKPCSLYELVKCTSFKSDYHPLHGIHGPNHLQHVAELSEQCYLQNALRFCWYTQEDGDDSARRFELLNRMCKMGLPASHDLDKSLVIKIITDRQDVNILHWAATGRSRSLGTPSWVPTPSGKNAGAPLPRVFGSFSYKNEYPWTLLPGWKVGSDGSLSLKGYLCGRIEAIGEVLTLDVVGVSGSKMSPEMDDYKRVIRNWEDISVSHLGKPDKKKFWQPLAGAFADTIHADDAKEQSEPYTERPGISIHAGDFLEWYRQYGSGILAMHEPEYFDTLETAKNWAAQLQPEVDHDRRLRESCAYYTENVERAIFGRRFFVTDDGSMGLAPEDSQSGDQLVFFPGGLYAFVIRPCGDGRGYELLGDCFLYGLNVFKLVQDQRVEDVILL